MTRRSAWLASGFLVLAVLAAALLWPRPVPKSHPWLVIGLDGADWKVIHRLWEDGRLPHLRRLAERGSSATLHTAHTVSPAIWTTVATGRLPRDHGITDFVVPTPDGDVPVSSTVRRVPALWNMLSASGRRAAVLGWWATWPAEQIEGIVVSDRALSPGAGRISPASLLGRLEAEIAEAQERGLEISDGEEPFPRDRLMTHAATEVLPAGFDLVLVYLHGIDTVSHLRWKYFEPEGFEDIDPGELERHRGRIPAIYEATDAAIGLMVETAGPDRNVLVLSDHGFHAADRELVKVWCDLDRILERLGYLRREGERVDLAESTLFTYASPPHQRIKYVRFALAGREPGGRVRAAERPALRERLARDLARVSYAGGAPVFAVRAANRREVQAGADLVVEVVETGASQRLRVDGAPLDGAIERISRVSGVHGGRTHGILLAAGPDVERGADLEGIHIHDIAPTLLYGLGLPVAADFAGIARQELFTAGFRAAHPLRQIPTWGQRPAPGATSTAEDTKLIDDLRALGYLGGNRE